VARGGVPTPTRRGAVVVGAGLLLAVAGALLESPPLVFAGAALVALVVAVVLSLLVRGVDVVVGRRFTPSRGVAGWSAVETLTVTPRSGRAQQAALRDEVPWGRTRRSAAVPVTLEPGRTATVTFRHPELSRGRHRVGPLHVELVESFGVARRRVVAPGTAEFVVVPEAVDLGLARESRSLGDGARRQREHSLSGGEDDPITREYRRGDPLRRVHWKATARHGDLMVRQEEQHGLPSARLVLALGSAGWSDSVSSTAASVASADSARVDVARSDAFEWALSVVATLGVEWGHAGSVAVLGTPGGSLVARHDPDATGAWLDALADLQLDDASDSLAPPPAAREPVTAVVSGLTRAELDQLGRSRAAGSTAVALVVSPTLSFTAVGGGAGPSGAEPTAVLPPEAVAASLREAGWRVVEATPTEPVGDAVRRGGLLRG